MKRSLASTALALALGFSALPLAAKTTSADWEYLQPDREQVIASLNVVELLKRHHYNKPPLNDERSVQIYDNYLKLLDPARSYFTAADIAHVETRVHQGAIDVLGRVTVPTSVHQAKFSMGTVLGLIAVHGKAGLVEFHTLALSDPAVSAFRDKVSMTLDREVDDAYPQRWLGRVTVTTEDGRTLHGAIDEPKGDPGNSLSRAELADKFQRLTQFSNARTPAQANALIDKVWDLRNAVSMADWL